MSTLETALRGGAVAILLLSVLLRARYARVSPAAGYSALLLFGVAAYVIDSAPGFFRLPLYWTIPIHVISCGTPAVFWVAATALFDDDFRPRWYHGLAWLWLAALAWYEVVHDWPHAIVTIHNASALLCVAFGIWPALSGRAADLVERRRQFRLEYAIGTALYIALVIASEWLWPGILGKPPFSLINALGLIALTFLFATLGLSRFGLEQPKSIEPPSRLARTAEVRAPSATTQNTAQDTAQDTAPDNGQNTAQDTALLEALRKTMGDGKAYREDGLSIASLSQKLNVQEYRLRRLINGRLGHRNFSAFVNGYRLAEAASALADPDQAEVPVLTIALDAGFGSIGPFNRAFKAYAGQTPSEYRRSQLGSSEIGSPIPESASRF
jgi:AraC-like DNA-binding protein